MFLGGNVQVAGVDYANYPTGSSGHEVYVFEHADAAAGGAVAGAGTGVRWRDVLLDRRPG